MIIFTGLVAFIFYVSLSAVIVSGISNESKARAIAKSKENEAKALQEMKTEYR